MKFAFVHCTKKGVVLCLAPIIGEEFNEMPGAGF